MEVFIISLIVGLALGILSGLLGIGGGTLMLPVFKLGYGMASIACTATSLFAVIMTSIGGTIGHVRNKTCLIPAGVAAGIGGACLSPVGVQLATVSPDWLIMLVAAAIILYSAISMLSKAFKPKKVRAAEMPQNWKFLRKVCVRPAVPLMIHPTDGQRLASRDSR